jgi:hypothetical protein
MLALKSRGRLTTDGIECGAKHEYSVMGRGGAKQK